MIKGYAMTGLDVFDVAHAQETDARGMTDGALKAETSLARFEVDKAQAALNALQDQISLITAAGGRTSVPDALRMQELAAAQAVNLAQLRLVTAEGEQRRRREWSEQEAAQQAALERAQRLAVLRDTAWAQYQADMGTTIDGVSLADRSAFDARWAEYLVDLSLGRVTLPES